jgi:hypothetical protein
MNNKIKGLVASAILFALGSAVANATPTFVMNEDTGHYYQVFASSEISWETAKATIESLHCIDPDGSIVGKDYANNCDPAYPLAVLPHLATITSTREDEFIEGIRQTFLPAIDAVWVGGFQDPLNTPGAGDNWTWINDEGSFPGDNLGPEYANWHYGEPNNAFVSGENHLAIGRFGNDAGWNDEGDPVTYIDGYVVEWDVPRPLETCYDGAGCVTIEGHTLEFPAESPPTPGEETLSFNSFEILDPRVADGDCGSVVLPVLGSTGIGPATAHPMIIPAYLCGSPSFIVVTVDTGGNDLTAGTILVTNDTFTALPDNEYPDGGKSVCDDPITQVPYSDGDPQYQDVVVWQSTDPAEMLEHTEGVAAGFPGAAGEFTFDCGGSSRARTRKGSDFGIGFHIDFGPGNTWAGNASGNFDRFVELTQYKLMLLEKTLDNAKAVSPPAITEKDDRKKMTKQVKNAIKQLDKGNFSAALAHVNNFLKFADKADYTLVVGENYEGELLMRGGNIEFMIRVKLIPYAPTTNKPKKKKKKKKK